MHLFLIIFYSFNLFYPFSSFSIASDANFNVYHIHQSLDLGNSDHNTSTKDYFINMGTTHGIKKNSVLEIIRKLPTFDSKQQQFYRDIYFPIAKIKIIHVELYTSVGKLESFYSQEKTPSLQNGQGIMVGDLVRPIEDLNNFPPSASP